MSAQKRKLSNFLLQPLLQVRLGLYSIVMSVVFGIGVFTIIYINFYKFYDLVLELTDLREEVTEILNSYIHGVVVWLVLALVVYFLVTVAISIFFTHRLIGPTYAFRRHIRDLSRGNYKSRVNLRKGDAFQEVADDLNDLAVALEKRQV
jgi:nitrate/nitrite-specific signal transduction histidine kinase